jgi:hypothetical protein
MKSIITRCSFAIALCLLGGAWQCSQSSQQKALTASRDFGASMVAAQQAVVAFATPCASPGIPYACGTISPAEDKALQIDFKAIADCGPKIDAAMVAGDKATITAAITGCNSDLSIAINSSAAGIKDPGAKAQVTSLLLAAQTVLNTALAFVQ